MHVLLVNPQIPPNTGNVIRLCANTGSTLHLVEPLGFRLDDAQLRRAGLDYHEYVDVQVHTSWDRAKDWLDGRTTYAFSSRGPRRFDEVVYGDDDVLTFGCEATGLDDDVLAWFGPERTLHLPMRPNQRSLNLSNAVAVAVFEAWRQHAYNGAVRPSPAPRPSL